jgi:putative ABC transport system ATP-binding protein
MQTQPIRIQALSKTYQEGERERRVLDSVDAQFEAGEFVAVRGPSGSGKTTLLNMLAGIDQPTRGSIQYGQVDFFALSPHERTLFRRDHIGFIFQFFNLIPTLTVLENILLPADLVSMDKSAAQRRARYLLNRVELRDRDDEFPDRLSGGEQQRVAIARALMLEPDVILADEPTGNLDRSTGDRVMELLNSLRRESSSTLVLVTHSRHIASQADRALTIEDGRLKPLAVAAADPSSDG